MRHVLIDKEKILENMRIKTMVVGAVATNCYIVVNDETKETLIVDPGDGAKHIEEYIEKNQLIPKAILLTHAHFDHIGAVKPLSDRYSLPIYMSEEEVAVAENPGLNLSGMLGSSYGIKPTHTVKDNEELSLAGFHIRAILTPGHTKGGMCFYFEKDAVLFSGDTLFYESVGRTDFPGGHMGQLVKGIKEKLFVLPDNVMVYPGHDMPTDIGHEKQYNLFIN